MPGREGNGRKNAAVVRVDEVTAVTISRPPVYAAATGPSPSVTWRLMFSSTTMASSTTRPMATISPPSVRMFKVMPCHHRTSNATMRKSGMDTAATRFARAAQEKEDDEEREERAERSLSQDVADRVGDGNGLVEDGLELDAMTDGVADVRQRTLDLVGHGDRVGVRSLDDAQADAWIAVGTRNGVGGN